MRPTHLERDGLWAIPTAEVPLTSLLSGEIVAEAELPVRLMGHTSCFRREAGSAGRETRGLLRVHEFDKVELYGFCTPDQAGDIHAEILDRAERAIADLGLAHRVLDLCAGDSGRCVGPHLRHRGVRPRSGPLAGGGERVVVP